jgi:hypothetical protein
VTLYRYLGGQERNLDVGRGWVLTPQQVSGKAHRRLRCTLGRPRLQDQGPAADISAKNPSYENCRVGGDSRLLEVAEGMTAHVFWNTVVVTGVYVSKGVENGKPYVRRGRFVDNWAFRDEPGCAWPAKQRRFCTEGAGRPIDIDPALKTPGLPRGQPSHSDPLLMYSSS